MFKTQLRFLWCTLARVLFIYPQQLNLVAFSLTPFSIEKNKNITPVTAEVWHDMGLNPLKWSHTLQEKEIPTIFSPSYHSLHPPSLLISLDYQPLQLPTQPISLGQIIYSSVHFGRMTHKYSPLTRYISTHIHKCSACSDVTGPW